MDESQLEASLEGYKSQAHQLETALAVTEDEATRAELSNVLKDMRQLVQLTEESLLSLRKSKLMSMLEGPTATAKNEPNNSSSDMDAEFAAFQAAIGEAGESENNSDEPYPNPYDAVASTNDVDEADEDEDMSDDDIPEELKEIIGNRCRVPFSHEWGEQRLHNALIVSVEKFTSDTDPKVRVMFCNPTHRSLLPCPFYLDGRCRFDDEQCRYSHGHIVTIDELEEFQEPDHSSLTIESKCIARYSDNVWYPGMIVDILENHHYKVMFDSYENTEVVSVEDIIPTEGHSESSDEDDSNARNDKAQDLSEEEDDSENAPVYLWRPNQTTEQLGDWEKHTKGVGSRLMLKMGYVMGQGLGKDGEGRAEPVPIQLLPPGKSLDKIMEMKERAGDKDLYDVMKKKKKKQEQVDKKAGKRYTKVVGRERSAFDFINKRLGGKKGNLNELHRPLPNQNNQAPRKVIAESELQSKSDKHINIQLLKTHDETKNVGKEIRRLKESLKRNERDGNKAVVTQLKEKLSSMESYLQKLNASEASMKRHQTMRSNHKKYTTF